MVFLTLGGYLADLNWRLPFLNYLLAWLILPFILLVLPEPQRNRAAKQVESMVAEAVPWTLLMMTYGIALVTQIVFYMIPVQIPFYLQQLTNANAAQSGLAIALATLATAISALSYQRLKAQFTFLNLYTIAFLMMGFGHLIISFVRTYEMVLVGLAIAGLGVGLLMPNMNVYLTSSTPAILRGRILGGLTTSFFLDQFMSPFVSQPLSKSVGLGPTYGLAGGFMLLLTLITLGITSRWK